MIKSAFNISQRLLCGIIVLASAAAVSCRVDDAADLPGYESESSDYIRVGAAVKANVATRGYKPSGPVEDGEFVLTYPFAQSVLQGDTTYTYSLANVKFGTSGAETMGFVTYLDKDSKAVDLKWSDVTLRKGTPGSAVFYLDNVSHAWNDSALNPKDEGTVVFAENEAMPFRAGVFDLVDGTNDLLWGTSEAYKNSKKVDFVLHHNMSRLRVVINVKPREDNGAIVDLSHVAKMEITNLYLLPEAFDRTTGNLILPLDPPEANSFPLLDIDNDELENVGELTWGEVVDDDTEFDNKKEDTWPAKIYTSKDFVFPPQQLANDSSRPKLRVTIPAVYAGLAPTEAPVTFEASLPQNMYASDTDEESENRRPMPLSFMKEHILTIRATIGPPEMELQFAPVYVEDWTDMGEHSITGQQAGIYNNSDFYDFLACYQAGNKVLLEKYGYKSGQDANGNDKWIIMFWSKTIDLDYDTIYHALEDKDNPGQSMHPDIPFSFSFNNYVLKVSNWPGYSEVSGAAGQIRLYNLLTGEDLNEPGIETHDDFLAMMKGYNQRSSSQMQKYGAYNNTDEQWVFEFTQKADEVFTLSYDEIHGMMNDTEGAGNFAINFRGHKVKITGLPDGREMVLSDAEGETLLHAILTAPAGIYSTADVEWLIKAYNSVTAEDDATYPGTDATGDISWMLELYGTESGGKWTFTYRRSMELNGPDIYATMVPDEESGKPEYDFVVTGQTIKVGDVGTTTYLYTPGAANLKLLFAAGGKITKSADLTNAVTYANNGNPVYRRYYGWKNEAENVWEYPITTSFEIAYTSIFGKLTSAEIAEFILVDETKVTVTGVPGVDRLICRGKQGAEILLAILRGTYTSAIPDPGIETPGDFTDLFKAYNEPNAADMQLYGVYSADNEQWVFGFTPTAPTEIEMPYGSLYNKMNLSSGAGDFVFSFGDRKVKVTELPDGGEIVLSGAAGEALLKAIVTARGQITSTVDLQWLIKAYNSQVDAFGMLMNKFSAMANRFRTNTVQAAAAENYNWILELFGSENAGKWTFVFGESLQLTGPSIYGAMIPDGDSRPDYDFTYAASAGVVVADDASSESVNPANLRKLFANAGRVNSASDLVAMANCGDNPIVRRYYGTQNPSTSRWSYSITASFDVSYAEIVGKLASIEPFDLHLATDAVVTLTNRPAGYRKIICEGSEGETTLYEILRGTYVNPEPAIRTTAEFEDMVAAYNDASRAEDLLAYGSNEGGRWTFWIRESMTLTGGDGLFGAMISGGGKSDYEFAYDSGVTVRVSEGGKTESVSEAQLKLLTTNGGRITSAEEFAAMIESVDNPVVRRFYGKANGAKWQYPVTASFSVKYDEIFGSIASAASVEFSLSGGVTVTVTDLPGGRKVACSGAAGASTLVEILGGSYTPAYGVWSGEVAAMIAAYKSGNANDMNIYGANAGGTWTFTFRESMTLTGSEIYGMMTSGGSYEFAYDSGVTVKVKDGSVERGVTTAELKTLFAASGQVASAADLKALVDATNSGNGVVRRLYGRLNGTTWQHPVAAEISIAYEEIAGKLSTGDTMAFSFTAGGSITVTGVPYGNDDIVCNGTTGGSELLLSILSGAYTPEPPATGGDDNDGDDNEGDDNDGGETTDPETQP